MKPAVIKISIFVFGFLPGLFVSACLGQQKNDGSVVIPDGKASYEAAMASDLLHIAMAFTDTTIYANGPNVYEEVINAETDYYK